MEAIGGIFMLFMGGTAVLLGVLSIWFGLGLLLHWSLA